MATDATERARLEQAYRRTTYGAGLSLRLRVGEPHPFLDEMLSFRGLEEYAYVTAWNPRSEALDEEENATRQDALRRRLRERGWHFLEGVARADDGVWEEESLLVMGIPRAEALALGREWGQHAMLVGRRGGAPELAWLD